MGVQFFACDLCKAAEEYLYVQSSSDHINFIIWVFVSYKYETLDVDWKHTPRELAAGGYHAGRRVDDVVGVVLLQDSNHTSSVPFPDEPEEFVGSPMKKLCDANVNASLRAQLFCDLNFTCSTGIVLCG